MLWHPWKAKHKHATGPTKERDYRLAEEILPIRLAQDLTMICWNLESDGSHVNTLVDRIRSAQGVDVLGFSGES